MTEKKNDKRTSIMLAAMELIAEQGFHGTPTSQIAGKAGVGVGTIYRYFKDKDELIEAIHEKVHLAFTATFAESYDPQLPVRENYLRIFTALTHLFIANPFEIKFMEQYYQSPYGVAKKRAEEVECEKPLADFFDAFLIGEGEEAVGEILDTYGRWQQEHLPLVRFLCGAIRTHGTAFPLKTKNYS